jgi:hypothetical protein
MASQANILRKFFIDQAIATTPALGTGVNAWPIVAGPAPTEHDRYLSIRNTGAIVAIWGIQRTGERVVFPTAQLRIRAEDEETAVDKGNDLITLMSTVGIPVARGGIGWIMVTVGGSTYKLTAARVIDGLTFLKEEEENQRQVYVCNVRLTLTLEA